MNPPFILKTHALEVISSHPGLTFDDLFFEIATGSNYTNNASIPLQGTTVYKGLVTGYSISGTIMSLDIFIPPEAGPFSFGEIGIFFLNNTNKILLASVVFSKLQDKLQETVSGISSTWRFSARLNFAQSRAVLTSIQGTSPLLFEVDSFSQLTAPDVTMGAPNAAIVHPPVYDQMPVLLIRRTNKQWYPVGWCHVATLSDGTDSSAPCVVQSGPLTTTSNSFTHIYVSQALLEFNEPGHYIVEDQNGNMSVVASVSNNTVTLIENTTWLTHARYIMVFRKSCDSHEVFEG